MVCAGRRRGRRQNKSWEGRSGDYGPPVTRGGGREQDQSQVIFFGRSHWRRRRLVCPPAGRGDARKPGSVPKCHRCWSHHRGSSWPPSEERGDLILGAARLLCKRELFFARCPVPPSSPPGTTSCVPGRRERNRGEEAAREDQSRRPPGTAGEGQGGKGGERGRQGSRGAPRTHKPTPQHSSVALPAPSVISAPPELRLPGAEQRGRTAGPPAGEVTAGMSPALGRRPRSWALSGRGLGSPTSKGS